MNVQIKKKQEFHKELEQQQYNNNNYFNINNRKKSVYHKPDLKWSITFSDYNSILQ